MQKQRQVGLIELLLLLLLLVGGLCDNRLIIASIVDQIEGKKMQKQ